MSQPGHNQPPSALDLAIEPVKDMSLWLERNPVIQTEEKAKEAKVLVDRVVEALRETEAERDSKVRPLNEQVAAINAKYKSVHNTDPRKPGLSDKILNELKNRIQTFLLAEEAKKQAALEEARRAAEEAERLAREAEAKERDAKEDAKMGVETDVAKATAEADAAFTRFTKADRAVARAEKDTKVKVAGGFGRAVSFRAHEVLSVASMADAHKALEIMGLTKDIEDAIIKSAREYRKVFEELPDGITVSHERKI